MTTPRTVGLEEELLLVDPETRVAVPRAAAVQQRGGAEDSPAADQLDRELFRHQVETRTDPSTDLDEIREQLLRTRRTAIAAAAASGLRVIASGTAPLRPERVRVTRDARYEDMLERYGETLFHEDVCGMHVHVGVDDDEEGVAVIDHLVPWLPVLLAVTTNSPFTEGRDTGYASWRHQTWGRLPSAGPTEPFGSAERYHEVSRLMIASGAARDPGMLYYDARLSADHPTVEVRIADVCTHPDDAVLVAALARGLATRGAAGTAARERRPTPWRAELLRAAQWRAARYGLGDRLVDPTTGELAPARKVLCRLVEDVREHLEDAGDVERVDAGVERVLAGTGAVRQRAAYARGGNRVEAVVDDLVDRTSDDALV